MVNLFSCALVLFFLTITTKVKTQPLSPPLPLDYNYPEDLEKAISRAASYLRRVANKDGSFKYQTWGSKETEIYPLTYNSVRHAGTIWSLTLYIQYAWYTKHSPANKSRDVAISATKWLYPFIVSPQDQNGTFTLLKGLLRTPKSELNENLLPKFALGGNGLALVALASMKELQLELQLMEGEDIDIDIEVLREMGQFIIYLMDEEGDFSAHYYYQGEGVKKEKKCDFYPGEAALGLIKLYSVDPQIKWLEAARDILEFLAKKHLNKRPEIVDHWYMIATQHLFIYQDLITLSKETLLVPCMISLAKDILNTKFNDWCITSALIEGLAGACLLFKQEFGLGHNYNGQYDDIFVVLKKNLIEWTKKLIACQVKGGGVAGSLGDVGTDNYEVRIDYNQHTMTAWIRTYEFLYSEDYVPKY